MWNYFPPLTLALTVTLTFGLGQSNVNLLCVCMGMWNYFPPHLWGTFTKAKCVWFGSRLAP